MKPADSTDTAEAERAALHALLFEHREGLALADVAVELGLTEARAEELLRAQEVQQLVRSDVDEDAGVLRYVTLRVSAPTVGARASVAALAQARAGDRARTGRARRVVLAGVVVLVVAAAGWLGIRWAVRTVAELVASAHEERAPGSSGDERAAAHGASLQRRAWIEEEADLDGRIAHLDADARASDCAARWASGDSCYVSHRRMTQPVFDDERARMVLRAAQLRRLLEHSR